MGTVAFFALVTTWHDVTIVRDSRQKSGQEIRRWGYLDKGEGDHVSAFSQW